MGPISLKTINLKKKMFRNSNLYHSSAVHTFNLPKKYLYEPNVAILKSGGFSHVPELLKVDKLHPHSHLYTSNSLISFPRRVFKIKNVFKYNKKKIKSILPAKKSKYYH